MTNNINQENSTSPSSNTTTNHTTPTTEDLSSKDKTPSTEGNTHSASMMPTPQDSPTTTMEKTIGKNKVPILGLGKRTVATAANTRAILQQAASPVPPMSPTCSVATQTADLMADWTEDGSAVGSTRKASGAGITASPNTAAATLPLNATTVASVGTGTSSFSDDILEGTIAVIMTLVLKGDQHWETSNPKRCKTQSAKVNIQHTISGMISALRESGLLRDEVAIAMTVYLRRLSAKHVKYVSRFTIKKYLVASCMVANKTCSDCYYCLDDYAAVVGISKSCIADSEIQFLTNIDYDVQIGIHHHEHSHHQDDHQHSSINFFQTSVLIHDMAMAAAAIVNQQALATAVEPATDSDLAAPSKASEEPTSAFGASATGPTVTEDDVMNGSATAINSIVSIVEGILASAEARI